ncbi:predicted protein [Histoplasma mississippiense (nom. inval.)]|uniref:predicted protein n=1 Tax=Ajellomyces capsulatus (strain NAm1 / WU24) TaxID=2059318 RepID=UPI000157C66D|nr:predicted protein [Histoplasma mississippiense (nom. inval.)]EDN08617.1 predicted protein [Histoplasma mississippiense (nom. inval.)]
MASLSASAERIVKKSWEESETSVSSTASIIDASNPFRLGFPAPLPALPVGHSSCDEIFPVSYDGIIREVASLLKRRDISWGSVVVVSRCASATVSDKRPTILITATAVKDDSWYLFVKETQEYLIKCSLDKVCVEIHDPEGLKIPAHFHIEPEHPIVSVWRKLQRGIITVLVPLCWCSLSVVRWGYGNNAQSNPVAIIITSKCPSELSHTKRTIQLRCQQYNLDRIEVCFVQVDTIFAAGGFRSPVEGRDFGVTLDLSPGASIGLSLEPRATASFGGNLIFRRGIEIHELGVTNFHIVASHQSLQGLTLSRQSTVNIDHAASLNVGLVSPSIFDANFKREIVENALDMERALSKLQAGMDAVNLESQALNNLNRATGTVWAGSGFRSDNGFGVDWALVSLPSSRLFLKKLPTSEELAALPPYIHPMLLFPDSGKVEDYVDSTVNFNGPTVSAWHVIGAHNVPFCDSGDSGSWLIDRNGNTSEDFTKAASTTLTQVQTSKGPCKDRMGLEEIAAVSSYGPWPGQRFLANATLPISVVAGMCRMSRHVSIMIAHYTEYCVLYAGAPEGEGGCFNMGHRHNLLVLSSGCAGCAGQALIGPGLNYITRIGGASPRRLYRRHDNDADNEDSTSIILIP